VHVSRDELNKLVMNYLILEGHKEGAHQFQKESGMDAVEMIDHEIIDQRVAIKKMILNGDIE
jgi:hypothetical protein